MLGLGVISDTRRGAHHDARITLAFDLRLPYSLASLWRNFLPNNPRPPADFEHPGLLTSCAALHTNINNERGSLTVKRMCSKMVLEWRKWLLMCLVAQTADAFSECTYSGYKRSLIPMPSSVRFRGQLSNRTSRSLSATLEASTMSSESDFADGRPKKKKFQKKRKSENPAHDTAFLRKRTANLLEVTAEGHHHTELHDSENSVETVLKANGATAEHANGIPRSRGMKVETKSFHFLIDAWAFSGELDAADQALALLDRMESLQDSDEFKVALDVRSYTKVINAVSRSKLPRAGEIAESILEKMDKLYASGANPAAKPNTHTYTAVIEAYANSGTESAAGKAEAMLEKLIERYESGDPDVRPTARCYNAVIKALAKSGKPDAAQRAEEIFNRMETMYNSGADEAKPNSFNYNSLITAWANCGDEGSAERAEQILERMEQQFRSGNDDCQPTTVSYNAVIAAYAKGGEEGAAVHAEDLLHRMEQRYEAGDENVKPNSRSFNSVINAWAKSQHVDSASRASELLDEMTTLSEGGNEAVRPDVHSFCSVINGKCWMPGIVTRLTCSFIAPKST